MLMSSGKKKLIIICVSVLLLAAIGGGIVFVALSGHIGNPRYQFGKVEYYSTADGSVITDSYCYSDDWFLGKATEENDSLALISMQLTATVGDDDPDGTGVRFLNELGFEETGFEGFDVDEPEQVSYLWGRKTIGSGLNKSTLVVIVIQSYSSDKEVSKMAWTQNFTVNGDEETDEFYSYSRCIDETVDGVEKLADGNTKYWIMGESRGGALTNILAARLGDRISRAESHIFAYTFEAPCTVDYTATKKLEENYAYIHNYICNEDIVTSVPPWNMTRYGTTYILDSRDSNAKLPSELQRMGSPLYDVTQSEYYGSFESEYIEKVTKAITDEIPNRADYSKDRTVTLEDPDGGEITLNYNYQDMLVKLMGVVFGDQDLKSFGSTLLENKGALIGMGLNLLMGVTLGSDSRLLQVARDFKSYADGSGIELPFTEDEYFGFFKLAAPIMIDASSGISIEGMGDFNMFGSLSPLMNLGESAKALTLSHHFDAVIARLKIRAGIPEVAGFDVSAGGDSAKEIEKALNSSKAATGSTDCRGVAWMTFEVEEGISGAYDVTLRLTGHRCEDDFEFTIEGEESISPLEITYEDGDCVIRGTWDI